MEYILKIAIKPNNIIEVAEPVKLSLRDIIGPSRILCVDTETTGLNPYGSLYGRKRSPARPFAISITSFEGKDAYYRFEVNPWNRKVKYHKQMQDVLELKEVLEDETIQKVFHNANFDIIMFCFAAMGIKVRGRVWDTLSMLHVFNNSLREYGLKPVTKRLFGMPDDDLDLLQKDTIAKRKISKKLGHCIGKEVEEDYWLADPELCKTYALEDTHRTLNLFIPLYEEYMTNREYAAIVDMELNLLPVIRRMMLRGHRIDLVVAEDLRTYYGNIIEQQKQIKADLGYAKLNENSLLQMKKVFYEDLKLPIQWKVTKDKHGNREKKPTVNSEALYTFANTYDNELANCLVTLGTAGHQLDSFVDPIIELSYESRIHTNYNSNGPITGRLSATKPNLMNITGQYSPNKKTDQVEYFLRKIFVPEADHLLYFFDYSQIEIWLTAFLSKEPILIDALLTGKDIHGITAQALFGHKPDFLEHYERYRKMGKIVNFASVYGAGAGALATQAKVSYQEGQEMHDLFWNKYRTLSAFNNQIQAKAKRDGKLVNAFGREYKFDGDSTHKAFNTLIQGTAAEIIKRAMINVDTLFYAKYEGKAFLQLTVHDELGVEVHQDVHSKQLMREMVQCMQSNFHTLFGMPNPFKVDPSITYTSWYDKEELDPITFEKKDKKK